MSLALDDGNVVARSEYKDLSDTKCCGLLSPKPWFLQHETRMHFTGKSFYQDCVEGIGGILLPLSVPECLALHYS